MDDANNETIRHWIRGALQMEKTTSEYRHQDIRNWCKPNISESKKKRPLRDYVLLYRHAKLLLYVANDW